MNILDNFFFVALPYMAIPIFLIGTIIRYRNRKFSVSSLSSQFLESGSLFWGSVTFHIGVILLFFGHLIAFLFPETLLGFNAQPMRLLIIEISAFSAGLLMLFGLVRLLFRRMTNERVQIVTTKMDIFIELLIIVQVILGLCIAYFNTWGSSWFASSITPYLNSLFLLNPDISSVSAMPWLLKWHIIGAYLILIMFPFSRLIHVLVMPLHYLGRPYQRVLWNWDRSEVRNPNAVWEKQRPNNN